MTLRAAMAVAALAATVALGGCAMNSTTAGSAGYGASGSLDVQLDPKRKAVAEFAVASRDRLARFELRSVSLVDAADPKHTLPAPIPANLVIVVDQAAREVTVWSPQTKQYFRTSLDQMKQAAAGADPQASPAPAATGVAPALKGGGKGWLALLKGLTSLSITMTVAGGEAVDGHATTALDINATQMSQRAVQPLRIAVHANLADEYDGFPLAVRARIGSTKPGKPPVELRLHMTNVQTVSPPAADFAPPEGYSAAATPAALIAPGGIPPGAFPPN
jgi:hypothetical protein